MARVGREVGEGGEHEPPLVHAGMRKREPRGLEHPVAVEQQVEVERPRPHRDLAHAPEPRLDREARVEQRLGPGQLARELDDAVQKPRLIDVADRVGLVERREPRPRRDGVEQQPHALEEVSRPVAEVRADGDIDVIHGERL